MALGALILTIALLDELVIVQRAAAELPRGRRSHHPRQGRVSAMSVVELSLVLMLLLFAMLGSGVWIALALAICGFVAIVTNDVDAAGPGAGHLDVGGVGFVGPDRAADVHLDGRNPLPHQIVRRHVRGPCALDAEAAGPAAARERGRLRDLCRGVGLLRRHLRNHRPHRAARIAQARLRREDGDRHARRLRHARPADPALDHPDHLRHRHRAIDRAAVHRRRHARHHAGAAVHGLHHGLGAGSTRTRMPPPEPPVPFLDAREGVAPADPGDAAHPRRHRLDLWRAGLGHRSGGGRRVPVAGVVVVVGHAERGQFPRRAAGRHHAPVA